MFINRNNKACRQCKPRADQFRQALNSQMVYEISGGRHSMQRANRWTQESELRALWPSLSAWDLTRLAALLVDSVVVAAAKLHRHAALPLHALARRRERAAPQLALECKTAQLNSDAFSRF